MNENQHPKLLDLLKAHENAFESPEILEAPRMHYVGYAELAAAVSNGGGLGTANELSNCITFHYELFINYVYLFIEFVRLPIHVISWIILACLHIFLFILASAVLALAMHVQCLCQRTASDIMYFHFDVIINHHIIIHYLELLQYYVHTYIYIYILHVCVCVCVCARVCDKMLKRHFGLSFTSSHTIP